MLCYVSKYDFFNTPIKSINMKFFWFLFNSGLEYLCLF